MSTQFNVDMYKNDQVTRRYSEGFKLKIIDDLSTGKYSKRQLSMIYGLRSNTINDWIKKYDRKDLMNIRIMVENHFFSTAHASRATKNAIEIYNSKRLHLTLDYKTPDMVFNMTV